ncbi:nicotinate (nicotinamide) nucleotide adenylyltransferase [bacterium]|nr:nicotinate (nicotinamide) nucleotide adenylyltransferase [bacterium]
MKLCVFQGTFNPIHNAHLRVAKYVLNKYDFDKLLFIPAYKPPHKKYDDNMSIHRLNMVKLAIEDEHNSKIEVSDIEYKREGKSYTYLTICELYKKYEIEGKINFIIGTDAFKDIENWYEADKLKKLVKFTVFIRENNFSSLEYNYLKDKGYDFIFDELSFEDISSTELREKIKNGQNIDGFINNSVKEYIAKNELYKT